MLKAYLDETNTHESGEIVVIAGFIGDATSWAALELRWREVLSNVGMPYFHAVECEAAKGVFSMLNRHLREALFRGLAGVISGCKLSAITAALIRSDWNRFKDGILGTRYETPYHFCFEHCIQIAATWSRTYGGHEPVELIVAQQDEYRSRAELLHHRYTQDSPWRNELGPLVFLSPFKCTGLQAADLLAYETQKYAMDRHQNRESPLRPAMQAMVAGDVHVVGGYYDADALARLQLHSPI